MKVHLLCYGVEKFEKKWKCSPCNLKKSEPVCKLCAQKGGAMKQTVCGEWVHVICALFTDGVIIEDTNEMEPIDIGKLSTRKRNKTCVFCSESIGFCCLCSSSTCKNRLHITCAQRANCLKEVTNKKDSSIKFRAYCNEHKPVDSARRISAQFVHGRMMEKKGRKRQQEGSMQMNQTWIIKETEEKVSADRIISEQPIELIQDSGEKKKNKKAKRP